MNPHVFREYDVRGVVDKDINEDFVFYLGRAIGTYARAKRIRNMTVGRDCRLSSEGYHRFLSRGLNAAGIHVIDIGMCATPMLYFSIRHLRVGGGVMITGSHNPPEFNGFKICIGHSTIFGPQIQDLRKIMESGRYAKGAGRCREKDIAGEYENYLFKRITCIIIFLFIFNTFMNTKKCCFNKVAINDTKDRLRTRPSTPNTTS